MPSATRIGVALCLLFLASCNGEQPKQPEADKDDAALTIFKQRILPIFQATKPSSCTECHLSGVDLKDYIHADQEKTFASLVASGLVDMDKPDDSKILRLINMRPEKPNLITDKVRQQEYEAFRAWLRAAVKDRDLLAAKSDTLLGPSVPDEVIRHARQDRVLASFIDNIWGEAGRCAACHSPDQNQKQVKKFGERVSWIVLRDPKATMEYMVKEGLFDASAPEKSLLLTKPTMQVDHKGGKKMEVGDRTYKQFRRFIDDYAAIAKNQYKTADQLPKASNEISVASDIWLKITGVPARCCSRPISIAGKATAGPKPGGLRRIVPCSARGNSGNIRSASRLPEDRKESMLFARVVCRQEDICSSSTLIEPTSSPKIIGPNWERPISWDRWK